MKNLSMTTNDNKKKTKRFALKKCFELLKDYLVNSDDKLVAWLLVIGITVSVIALVALMATLSWWSAGFWAALTAKALTPFLITMGQFSLIVGAYVGVHVLKNYMIGKLSIRWRSWLTKKFLNNIFNGDNNYLDLKRFSADIDNASQRIQEDIKTFVDLTLYLSSDLLKSTLALGTFVGTLWVVGGPLAFVALGINIIIPGYLVWLALIIAIVATVSTHLIGKSLARKNKQGERAEADFRQELEILNDDAENIAQEHGEHYYKQSLNNKIRDIQDNATLKLNIQSKLVAFQNFYMQLSDILPYLLAAPLYFTGVIELGQLMQIAMSFGQVSASLSWFVDTYENLATYETSLERLVELQQAFKADGLASNPKSIVVKEKNVNTLNIKRLNVMQPQITSTQYIMRNLNLTLTPGEHLLIKGPSGLGKSTLFKAIAGTWKYGNGKINLPHGKNLYFLPQKPTLPYDTLMCVLAYPDPVETYTEEQYIGALNAVGGMNDFIIQLNKKRAWSKELSAGQQQRISFARALLKKPDWLFLDEATASLDEESEHRVYSLMKTLKNTTIVSIAHRQTVEKYHNKIVNFSVNNEKEIEVQSLCYESSV